ncbi:helix-turn-helix domain-containing protein [Actinomadura fibrosa]|uniref:Helix-turn-helix domain-containing protein n=1 Tax=Actinomadura fibrosa TaxID=111802 RepID=A0ABW2Y0U0_9ACTN|nr:helix-turn-helix transcriptional regulator [Actinomadura fibrosa]
MARTRRISPELLSFGAEIKRLRNAAGLSQAQLAKMTNVTRSYITQVETGHTRCRRDFAVRLDRSFRSGTTVVEAWEELLEAIKVLHYPDFFMSFPRAEASAVMLRAYEERVIYGLFQTEAYIRALLDDEEAIKGRLKRQEILDNEPRPTISVVMDETVLYRQVGTKSVMREQLEHLIELSKRDWINIQIVPIRYIRNLWTSFAIATQADQRQVVYTDKAYGGETSTQARDIEIVSNTFVTLQAEALNAIDTRALIRKVVDDRWT